MLDGVMLPWFLLTTVALMFAAIDIRTTPESQVLKWASYWSPPIPAWSALSSARLDKLRRGEISALAYVATKPFRLFQDIRPDENLHFLPITGNLPANYRPVTITSNTITSNDYRELISNDAPVRPLRWELFCWRMTGLPTRSATSG